MRDDVGESQRNRLADQHAEHAVASGQGADFAAV